MQGLVEMTIIITPSTRRMIRELEPVIPEMFEPAVRRDGPAVSRDAAVARGGERRRDRTRRTDWRERLADADAADVVRRSLVHQTATPIPLRTISHLLARDDVGEFRRAVATVERGREFQFLVIGPRAPYSFCALRVGHRRDARHESGGLNIARFERTKRAATSTGRADDPTVAALHAIARALPDRINADPEHVEQGLARLVLTVIELLREVLEHQAIRRMDGGTLTEAEDRTARAGAAQAESPDGRVEDDFGLTDEDLNIDLGPLGRLR